MCGHHLLLYCLRLFWLYRLCNRSVHHHMLLSHQPSWEAQGWEGDAPCAGLSLTRASAVCAASRIFFTQSSRSSCVSAATSRDTRDTEAMLMEKTKRRLFFPSGRMAVGREQRATSPQMLSHVLHTTEGGRESTRGSCGCHRTSQLREASISGCWRQQMEPRIAEDAECTLRRLISLCNVLFLPYLHQLHPVP